MKRLAKLILLALAGLFIINFLTNKKIPAISTKPALEMAVEQSMLEANGRYGIYIKNLKSGESYKSRENEVFEAGSLYKLWLMAMIFEKIKEGKLNADDPLEADVRDLNNQFGIDEDTAELKEGTMQFSVLSAIEQMITISHNYAALTLLTKTSRSEVESFIKTLGIKDSTMEPPAKTTAQDLGIFFEKLSKGEIVDQVFSKQMLDILDRQKINDRIPKLLPEGVKIAHKTADLGFFENDGGIVFSEKGDYIIVVLSETDSPEAAGVQIANLSKAIFEYFNK